MVQDVIHNTEGTAAATWQDLLSEHRRVWARAPCFGVLVNRHVLGLLIPRVGNRLQKLQPAACQASHARVLC